MSKIRVFGCGDTGGCGFYRIGSPLYELSRDDRFDVGYQLAEHFAIPGDVDILVASRLPGHAPLLADIARAQARGMRFVYDLDDDIFNIDPDNGRAVGYYTPEILRGVMALIQMADLLTVSTPYLAGLLGPFARRVEVLPNLLPDSAFLGPVEPHEGVIVGWAGGDSHYQDLLESKEAVRSAISATGATLHVIGYGDGDLPNPWLDIPGVRFSTWAASVEDYYERINFDIALAPLRISEFVRSKSPIKAMEAGARMVPTIARQSEAYSGFVVNGVTGVEYTQQYELRSAIRRLARDSALRADLGAAAHDLALGMRESQRNHVRADIYASLLED